MDARAAVAEIPTVDERYPVIVDMTKNVVNIPVIIPPWLRNSKLFLYVSVNIYGSSTGEVGTEVATARLGNLLGVDNDSSKGEKIVIAL
jgi:hypothetical protein